MRYAHSSTSRRVADETTSELVGYFDALELQRGFASALAKACRTGVAIKLRDDAFAVNGRVLDGAAARREAITEALADTAKRAKNAAWLAQTADSTEDAAYWESQRKGIATEARDLERQLAALGRSVDLSTQRFEADTTTLARALARIASVTHVSQEEHNAYRMAVPALQLKRQPDGTWYGQATVRIPTKEGVAEIGPIQWPVVEGGRGTQIVRAARPPAPADSSGSRRELLAHLLEVPGMSREAALVLVNAPFQELPAVVLNRGLGRPVPESVKPDWLEPTWVEHVFGTYTAESFHWLHNGRYAVISPLNQAVVDTVSDVEPASLSAVRALLPGLDGDQLWPLGRPRPVPLTLPVGPLLQVEGAGKSLRASARRCHCGLPATAVTRVPEVPGDLMCPNGHIAAASDLATIRLPAAYTSLRISREAWRAQLPALLQPRDRTPAPTRASAVRTDILGALASAGAPMTSADVAQAVGRAVTNVHTELVKLASDGRVERLGRYPTSWRSI